MADPLLQIVIDTVVRYYGADMAQILSADKRKPVAFVRQTAMYVARVVLDVTYQQIGEAFGRDHSTVLLTCNKVKYRADMKASYRSELDALVELVRTAISEGETAAR